ncbi:MAG: hypothetical protein KAX13_06330, partial [Candidatus Krumholzibacteria bacterium]|nr:hypothetical protein [Candidatus Krumholzibacteria bacterium]
FRHIETSPFAAIDGIMIHETIASVKRVAGARGILELENGGLLVLNYMKVPLPHCIERKR